MTKAENIRNQCMKILDKYDADYRGVTVDRIDGTTYVIFKYYGGTNDTIDRNDDSWDEMFELDGVVDVGYGEGYGIKGKYEDSLLIELDEDIVESKTSSRKSIKESSDESYLDEVRGFYFSNLDVGEECEVQFADFVMPCRISQFYKNHRYVYLIAETIHGKELYFVITYAYIRNKFVLSKYFSSYGKAENELLNKISSVL